MTGLPERAVASNFCVHSTISINRNRAPVDTEQNFTHNKSTKASLWSSFFASTFSLFESYIDWTCGEKKETKTRSYGWTTAVKEVVTGGSMKRLQELILGTSSADVLGSISDVWLLGASYKVTPEESSKPANGLVAFLQDFSSRIWMTYRKGFDAISDSKFTSDVNWGCMIRSSQMLIAQALLFHHLGRSWRKPFQTPYDPEYIEILQLFGDSVASAFSIHNLLQVGSGYGLAAGSWVGPYAMCRVWETLARINRDHNGLDKEKETFPMAIYIVSGDEDGEQGGAPVVCTEVTAKLCYEFSKDQHSWAPILLLVPLVLGLEKVNPRYIPLLRVTFTFPQSLGILGGKPGASTYIVGVQDDKALYLDPHEVQPAIDIRRDNLEADTSSYHCNVVRHLPLDLVDPSLAIGFYCRDKDDFEDFCSRASELGDKSNGAPLFTVAQSFQSTKSIPCRDAFGDDGVDEAFDGEDLSGCGTHAHEDEWQIL